MDNLIELHAASYKEAAAKEAFLLIISIRRSARKIISEREIYMGAARQHRRNARILERQESPFNAARMEFHETSAKTLHEKCKELKESIRNLGQILVCVAGGKGIRRKTCRQLMKEWGA